MSDRPPLSPAAGTGAATAGAATLVAPGEPVVAAVGVVKQWGATRALDGATFTIGPGITGLLGSNGAGKTTLLGMILGLHNPTSGSLRVLGLDPSRSGHEVRGRVGYAPELHTLPDDMRAHDLVRHITELHGIPRREATARASDVLWQVGLGEERFRPIGTMSTGQRQRVKLAQAIAHDPALVLLDEPTDGLDPVQRDDMLALIRRVGTEFGINVILSSHLLEEVERICDSTVILGGGRVVADGRLTDLTRHTEGVVVEVVDQFDPFCAEVRARGADIDFTDTAWQVLVRWPDPAPGSPDQLHDLVRDALVASGAGLRRMAPRRVSLEDVFMELGT